MNSGGEPERDDTGLPPVDIQVPDDARELDRDVQAYLREQRALRRSQRRSRLHGLLARDGIVLPLLACCLILALITGTLLTVFTAASDQGFGSLPGGTAQPATASAVVTPIPELPDVTVQVGGQQTALRSLSRAMLLFVPASCACTAMVGDLGRLATGAHAPAYLVSDAAHAGAATRLAARLTGRFDAPVGVAVAPAGTLGKYQSGLTAIVIGPHRSASVAANLTSGTGLGPLLRTLNG